MRSSGASPRLEPYRGNDFVFYGVVKNELPKAVKTQKQQQQQTLGLMLLFSFCCIIRARYWT